MVGDLHIRIAKLAFHAKESPIRTRTESSILYLRSLGVRRMMIVRLFGHPLVQDSLSVLELFPTSNGIFWEAFEPMPSWPFELEG